MNSLFCIQKLFLTGSTSSYSNQKNNTKVKQIGRFVTERSFIIKKKPLALNDFTIYHVNNNLS